MTRRGLARAVSIILHPMIVLLVATAAAARRLPPAQASRAMLVVALIAVIPFTIFVVRQVRAARWENVDASRPEERPRLFVVTLILMAVLGAVLSRSSSIAFLSRGVFAAGGMLLIAWALLRWVKVSLHVACLSMVAVSMTWMSIPLAITFGALVPFLAWARVTMQRHTLVEIALGALLGIGAGLAIVFA